MQNLDKTITISEASRRTYQMVEQEVNIGVQAFRTGSANMAVTSFRSALNKLKAGQPFHDHLVHNLLLSYRLCIENALNASDESTAMTTLRSALELDIRADKTSDPEFGRRFASAYQELGLVFFHHRRFHASALCSRKAISIDATPGSHINLLNALSLIGKPAVLSDFTSEIKPDQLGRHIFIACVPKSGSTFLKNVLVSLTGYSDVFMVYSASQFEQDIYQPTLSKAATIDTVTQQHCRASDTNVHLMQAFGIRPVVLVRNIFDSVMSLLDFYDNGAYFSSFHRFDYPSLDRETRIDLLIDNFVPWYFQFFASWADAEKQQRLEISWLTYEDLIADKLASIQDVLKFYGLGAPVHGIEEKIRETESEKRKTRFNKGVAGRGASGLTNTQKDRICRFVAYYPSTDFSRIGISR